MTPVSHGASSPEADDRCFHFDFEVSDSEMTDHENVRHIVSPAECRRGAGWARLRHRGGHASGVQVSGERER